LVRHQCASLSVAWALTPVGREQSQSDLAETLRVDRTNGRHPWIQVSRVTATPRYLACARRWE